jgi:AcrR family transcriptional regulator
MSQELKSELSTQRILDATRKLHETKSAQYFQVRDIAAAAGCSAALVIQRFKSKDQLVFAATMAGWRDGIARTKALVADPSFTLNAFYRQTFEVDLGYGHRVKDLMTMSWWWLEAEEAEFQAAVELRRQIQRDLMIRDYALDAEKHADKIAWADEMLTIVYTEHMRRANIHRQDWATAYAGFERAIAPLLRTLNED